MASGSDVDGDCGSGEEFVPAKKRRKREPHRRQKSIAFVLARNTVGANIFLCVAVLSWRHVSTDDADASAKCASQCNAAAELIRQPVSGFLCYDVDEVARLQEPCLVDHALPHLVRLLADALTFTFDDQYDNPVTNTFAHLLPILMRKHRIHTYVPRVAWLSLHLAESIARGSWENPIHVTAVPLRKTHAKVTLLAGFPSAKILRALRVCPEPFEAVLWQQRSSSKQSQELRAEEYIEFLAASATCNALREMPAAEKAWRKIFERRNGALKPPPLPCYELLRRARVRLDMAILLAWRMFFSDAGALFPGMVSICMDGRKSTMEGP